MYKKNEYQEATIPEGGFIGRGEDTEDLYDAEERRNKIIERCVREWMKICDVPKASFWRVGVPQVLMDTLSSYAPPYSFAAVFGFLRAEIPRQSRKRRREIRDRLREAVELIENLDHVKDDEEGA